MAGKKSKPVVAEWTPPDFSKPSRTAELITKSFGVGIVKNGREVYDNDRKIVSISPAVDAGIGGGIVEGTMSTITGPPGCGKTTIALHMAKKWQMQERMVVYLNPEQRLYRMNLDIPGFDVNKMEVVESRRGRVLTAEDYLEIAEKYLNGEQNILMIVDSFSILSDNAEMTQDDYRSTPPLGGSQRLLGRWCRKNAANLPLNNNTVIGIAHQYTNLSPGPGVKWKEALPEKVKYARSMGLACKQTKPLTHKSGEDAGGQWGMEVQWKVTRSALGGTGSTVWSCLRFGYGIDEEYELLQLGKSLGLIEQGGAMYKLLFLDYENAPSVKGMNGFRKHMQENPEHAASLAVQVRELSVGVVDEDEESDEGS